jgi:WD40 repeat protein
LPGEAVLEAAFSPDGRSVLTRSRGAFARDIRLRLWDAAAGRALGSPVPGDASIGPMRLWFNDRAFLSARLDEAGHGVEVRAWETPTGKALGPPVRQSGTPFLVALSPDGHTALVATALDQDRTRTETNLWATATGERIAPLLPAVPHFDAEAAFSPDGKLVVTCERGQGVQHVRRWDAATGKLLHEHALRNLGGAAAGRIRDGQSLLIREAADVRQQWDTATATPAPQAVPGRTVTSPDGKLRLTWQGTDARLWKVDGKEPVGEPLRHAEEILGAFFSSDSETVLTGAGTAVQRWSAATGTPVEPPLEHPGRLRWFEPLHGGKFFWTGQSKRVRFREAASGKPLGPPIDFPYDQWRFDLSLDGKTVLLWSAEIGGLEGSELRLWDVAAGKPRGKPLSPFRMSAMGFLRDGKIAFAAGTSREYQRVEVHLWDPATGDPVGPPLLQPAGVGATRVLLCPDGKTLVVSGGGRGAAVWDLPNGKQLRGPLPDAVVLDGRTLLRPRADFECELLGGESSPATGATRIGFPGSGQRTSAQAVFSPDGKLLATVAQGGNPNSCEIRLWDAVTQEARAVLLRDSRDVAYLGQVGSRSAPVLFSPDGKRVLVVLHDTKDQPSEARLWSTDTGEAVGPPLPLSSGSAATALGRHAAVFSPDSRFVLTLSGDGPKARKELRLWEAATGRPFGSPLGGDSLILAAAFGPDCKAVCAAEFNAKQHLFLLRRWDVSSGQALGTPTVRPLAGDAPPQAVFSTDGRLVALAPPAYQTGEVRLWDTATGKPSGQPLAHPGAVHQILFGPDDTTLVTQCSTQRGLQLRLWEVATGRQRAELLGIGPVCYSPDGRLLLAWSKGQEERVGTARVWEAAEGRLRLTLENVADALFRGDGSTVVTVGVTDDGRRRIEVRDTDTGRQVSTLAEVPGDPATRIFFAPDARRVAVIHPRVVMQLEDPATGKAIGRPMVQPGAVEYPGFLHDCTADGKRLLTAVDREARAWDSATGEPLTPHLQHPSTVRKVAFSPDGRTIVTLCSNAVERVIGQQRVDGEIRLWEASAGRLIGAPIPCPTGFPTISFSPGGRVLTLQYRAPQTRLHDLFTLQPLSASLALPNDVQVFGTWTACGPDGMHVLTYSFSNPRVPVQLWDAATGRKLRDLPSQERAVGDLGFGPDDKTILVSLLDHRRSFALPGKLDRFEVRRWETATGKPLEPPLEEPLREAVLAYSADARTALACHEERAVAVRHAVTGADRETAVVGQDWPTANPIAWSPGGRLVLAAHDGEARVWDQATGAVQAGPLRHPDPVMAAFFSPDSKAVLTDAGEALRLWDVATGESRGQPLHHGQSVPVVAWSADGRSLAIAVPGGQQKETQFSLLDVATGVRRTDLPSQAGSPFPTLLFSPNSKILLAAGGTQACFYDAATGTAVGEPLKQTVSHAAFSPDGRLVALAGAEGVLLWDVASGVLQGPALSQPYVTALAFNRDGSLLAAAGDAPGPGQEGRKYELWWWDVRLGRRVGAPAPLPVAAERLTFKPDGRGLLAVGSREPSKRVAQLWPVPAPAAGTPERLQRWVQVVTGMELDADGRTHVLGATTWVDRKWQLTQEQP